MGASFDAMGQVSSTSPASPGRQLARKLLIDLAIMTVIGVFLALIGPLGSINDPLAIRLMVWLGLSYAGYLIYSPMGWLVEKAAQSLDLPRIWLWVAGVMIATVPMAVVVWSLNQMLAPVYRFPAPEEALVHYGYVLIIGGGITLLFHVIQRPSQSAPVPQTEAKATAPASPARLVDRLPPELGSDIIALEMEDHYVRVHTSLGSEMVLLRLRDAIGELEGIEGLQVHRSWWVARGAVESVIREGRNVRLQLARDIQAPVSRAQVAELKDAGWL